MEEKKGTKTHRLLITFLIIIVLIILIITSFYIYLQINTTSSVPDSKEVEITELKSQIQKLETELANANNSTSTQANTTEDSSS